MNYNITPALTLAAHAYDRLDAAAQGSSVAVAFVPAAQMTPPALRVERALHDDRLRSIR